ncbi:hypothetical protein NONI108955_04150 [Nocardia ninae]|uniref:Uncharacterized protein n=2 Tax=Nocardia ninae TaxID=356145 RepID=A0A511MJH9_9NOCA|nr:hypothetical protein NN4_47960 [Nocardia ninae NBRC 108245]
MHWDQMTATPDELHEHATRVRRAVGQLGVLESIITAADGPWLGAMDADGRGAAELKMHLAGRYRLTVVVTSAGKISLVQMNAPAAGQAGERVLSSKPSIRRGWDDTEEMPKQPDWLDYVVEWVRSASEDVDRRAVIEWRLTGADLKLAAMNDTIDSMRASLAEREQLRDELAAEVVDLRTELDALDALGARE